MQGEVLDYQEEECFPERLHEGGRQEVVPCRHDASKNVVRLKLRRQMAAAAGKKSTISFSLFMEAYRFEVEEELSTVAFQHWTEAAWTGK